MGEKQIEIDKRLIRREISKVKVELNKVFLHKAKMYAPILLKIKYKSITSFHKLGHKVEGIKKFEKKGIKEEFLQIYKSMITNSKVLIGANLTISTLSSILTLSSLIATYKLADFLVRNAYDNYAYTTMLAETLIISILGTLFFNSLSSIPKSLIKIHKLNKKIYDLTPNITMPKIMINRRFKPVAGTLTQKNVFFIKREDLPEFENTQFTFVSK